VVQGRVPKEDGPQGYGTGQRLLVELRMAGGGCDDPAVPLDWVAGNTRWMRKPTTHSGAKTAPQATADLYRRNLWRDADYYVEVWCEKDAMAGVLFEETRPYDVPLMVARGFSSITYLYNAARTIAEIGKPAYIYHLVDHDPSGRWAARDIENKLRKFAPEAEI